VCAATSAPVAGVFADYASIVPAAVGNSAGTVTLKAAPANKLPLASAKIAVSWRGMQTWSRTATAPGAVALPSIPVGVAGFKVTVTVKLADGTTLTSSAALRRTR
jgi:hypothetical protein